MSNDLTEFEKSPFSNDPNEQRQPATPEVYGYPQRAMQLLFEGYSSPSTSNTRLKCLSSAKELFQIYSSSVLPEMPLSEIPQNHLPAVTYKELEALFPFQPHKLREGEPSAPVFHEGEEFDILDYSGRLRAYDTWASQQPDKSLLLLEKQQQQQWREAGGRVEPTTLFTWWRHRRMNVVRFEKQGLKVLLDTYWPDNQELRMKAPQQWQEQRIVPKSS